MADDEIAAAVGIDRVGLELAAAEFCPQTAEADARSPSRSPLAAGREAPGAAVTQFGLIERIDVQVRRRQSVKMRTASFETVKEVGLTLPDVEAATKYDGSRLLRVDGVFVAGLATHHSAEPGTLVVRTGLEERQWLLEDAPETYYVTDYYRPYPIVLVRLSWIDRDALRELLTISRRLAIAKTRKRRNPHVRPNRPESNRGRGCTT